MTSAFVSHSSQDDYFVDFLIELLEYHRIDVWVDRSHLKAGVTFTTEIEEALASCDSLVAVLSHHSSGSPWMTREISTFKALNPDRLVIPLVLDREADVDAIYEGLGLVKQLRCYESLLKSFSELLSLLGRTLFPVIERRASPDRRAEDRRTHGDRRKASTEHRMRVGIWLSYTKRTGRAEYDLLEKASDVAQLVEVLVEDNSPLESFEFVDRKTGEQVRLDIKTLQAIAFKSWRSKRKEYMKGAVYIIDDVIDDLMAAYVVTPKTRRAGQRRNETSRRRNIDPRT